MSKPVIYNSKTHNVFLLDNFTSIRAEQSIWNKSEGEWKIVGKTVGMDGITTIGEFESKEEAIDVLNFILRNINNPTVKFITISEGKCTTNTTPPAGREIMPLKNNASVDAETAEECLLHDAREFVEKNRDFAEAIVEALNDVDWIEETERVYRGMRFGVNRDTVELCDSTKELIQKIAAEAKDAYPHSAPLGRRSLFIERLINEKYAG